MIRQSVNAIVARSRRFLTSEDGPTATEYAIMLALIAAVSIVVIQSIGERIFYVYEGINGAVGAVGS